MSDRGFLAPKEDRNGDGKINFLDNFYGKTELAVADDGGVTKRDIASGDTTHIEGGTGMRRVETDLGKTENLEEAQVKTTENINTPKEPTKVASDTNVSETVETSSTSDFTLTDVNESVDSAAEQLVNEVTGMSADEVSNTVEAGDADTKQTLVNGIKDLGLTTDRININEDGTWSFAPIMTFDEYKEKAGTDWANAATIASIALGFLSGGKFPPMDFNKLTGSEADYNMYVKNEEHENEQLKPIIESVMGAGGEKAGTEVLANDESYIEDKETLAGLEGNLEALRAMPTEKLDNIFASLAKGQDAKTAATLARFQDLIATGSAKELVALQEEVAASGEVKKLQALANELGGEDGAAILAILAAQTAAGAVSDKNVKNFVLPKTMFK